MAVYFPTSVFLPVIPWLHLFPASDTGTQCHLVVLLYFERLWVVALCNDSMLQSRPRSAEFFVTVFYFMQRTECDVYFG